MATSGRPGSSASIDASKGSASAFGDANRVVDDRLAYRITAKGGNDKTDVEEIDNKRAYLGLSASFALSEATELELMASYHDDAPISPTGVPNELVGLVDAKDLQKTYLLRRILNPMGTTDAIEFLIDKLKQTKTNSDFFDSMNT